NFPVFAVMQRGVAGGPVVRSWTPCYLQCSPAHNRCPTPRTVGQKRMDREHMILHRCFGMAAAMLLLSTAAQAADYRLTIAFDKTNPATPLIGESFAKHLESASKGQMKI